MSADRCPLLIARTSRPLGEVLAELRAEADAQRAVAVGPSQPASGLVSLSTTVPQGSEPQYDSVFQIVTDEARLKRMKRRVCKAAEVHGKGVGGEGDTLQPAMITTTYCGEVGQWRPEHISDALRLVRKWMARRGYRLRYVWVAELQERGEVHYHVLCWLPRARGQMPPFWDKQGWWPHGSTRCEWAYSPVGYMAKYATKVGQKDRLPGGARMHGSGGFTVPERLAMSHHSRPTWARLLSSVLHRVTKPRGGGVAVHYACGLARRVASPFVLVARGSGRVVVARRDTSPDRIRASLSELFACSHPTAA